MPYACIGAFFGLYGRERERERAVRATASAPPTSLQRPSNGPPTALSNGSLTALSNGSRRPGAVFNNVFAFLARIRRKTPAGKLAELSALSVATSCVCYYLAMQVRLPVSNGSLTAL